jgi:hypothetical protein
MKKLIIGYTLNHFMIKRKVGQPWLNNSSSEVWICPTKELAETIRDTNIEWSEICTVSGMVSYRIENGLFITRSAEKLIIQDIEPEPPERQENLKKPRHATVQIFKDAGNYPEVLKNLDDAKQKLEEIQNVLNGRSWKQKFFENII